MDLSKIGAQQLLETTQSLHVKTEEDATLHFQKSDIIQAEITEIDGDTVTLKLPDGKVLTAKIENIELLHNMETVELIVNHQDENHLTLQLLWAEPEMQPKANIADLGALRQLVGKYPAHIADARLDAFIQLDRSTALNNNIIEKIFEGITKHETISAEEAVFFAANNIDITEENIEVLHQLLSEDGQIAEQLEKLAQDVVPQQGQQENAQNNTEMQPLQQENVPQNFLQQAEQTAPTIEEAPTHISRTAPQEDMASPSIQQEDMAPLLENTRASSIKQPEGDVLPETTDTVTPEPERILQQVQQEIFSTQDTDLKTQQQEHALLLESLQAESPNESEANTGLSLDFAKLIELPKEEQTAVILKQISSLFASIRNKKEGGESLQQAAQALPQKLGALYEMLELSSVNNKELASAKADALLSQAKLMDDMMQFSYVQIPIQLEKREQTAELFIYREKKRKTQIDPENASILLALDTENMGRVETLIDIKGKGVSLTFQLEEHAVEQVFKQNVVMIAKLLEEEGFKLADIKTKTLEVPTTLLNAEKVLQENFAGHTRKTVDIQI